MVDRNKARILLVEDDATIQRSLVLALRRDGYEVTAESDGRGIQELADRTRPDLALLDVRLPVGPGGYEMAEILRRSSRIPILFLTAADSPRERLRGFEAGADDYVTKPFELEELLARVKALLRRAGHQASGSLRVGDLMVDETAHVAMWNGVKLELTRTEYDLLTVLARHSGQVMSKEQLLGNVWGFDAYNLNLVEVHMSSLRRKLEAVCPRVVHTVRGIGYVLRA
ncbi:MAG TPA: response regulator transcription factor [Acidimicrobiales bacterium]|nr:response regulator transcription factor [Acidimicrobiales bacterium]